MKQFTNLVVTKKSKIREHRGCFPKIVTYDIVKSVIQRVYSVMVGVKVHGIFYLGEKYRRSSNI
jgi:hypothetical protein